MSDNDPITRLNAALEGRYRIESDYQLLIRNTTSSLVTILRVLPEIDRQLLGRRTRVVSAIIVRPKRYTAA